MVQFSYVFFFGPIDCIVYDDRAGALICEAPLASTVGCVELQTEVCSVVPGAFWYSVLATETGQL